MSSGLKFLHLIQLSPIFLSLVDLVDFLCLSLLRRFEGSNLIMILNRELKDRQYRLFFCITTYER